MRENAYDRGRRLLVEGRVIITRVDATEIEALVRGDHGEIWQTGYRPGAWYCECEARTWCAHLYAVALCTKRPGRNPR
jgi:hypothetical protein